MPSRRIKCRVYICQECGQSYHPFDAESKYCCLRCSQVNGGGQNKKSEVWYVSQQGYVQGHIWVGDKIKPYKYHRFVMEKHLGRKLLPTERVHHIDGNRLNNDISNLKIMSASEHSKLHALWRGNVFPASNKKENSK